MFLEDISVLDRVFGIKILFLEDSGRTVFWDSRYCFWKRVMDQIAF